MVSWLVGVVVCVALLAGCGGGQKGNLVKRSRPARRCGPFHRRRSGEPP